MYVLIYCKLCIMKALMAILVAVWILLTPFYHKAYVRQTAFLSGVQLV
jgi:hypothetical protein